MNTRIEYLYRDADNYKVPNEAVVKGAASEEQIRSILDSLYEGEFFIPAAVGLPEERFSDWDDQSDHPFFELCENDFSPTDDIPNCDISINDLMSAFVGMKDRWEEYAVTHY